LSMKGINDQSRWLFVKAKVSIQNSVFAIVTVYRNASRSA
jgi:hypothetical protein